MNNRFKGIRLYFNLSRDDFAKKISTTPVNIFQIESGKRDIHHKILTNLKNTLNVNINWLLTGEGEMFLNKKIKQNTKRKLIPKIMGLVRSLSLEDQLRFLKDLEDKKLLNDFKKRC